MKKRIANGIQLMFMIASFAILWIPCIKSQHVDLIGNMPIDSHVIGIMPKGNVYALLAVYAVTALLCIISIVVKPEHKDGKIHIIMSIVLFIHSLIPMNTIEEAVGTEWMIAETDFPVYLYLGCHLATVIVSIAKRSTIITGLPSKKEKIVVNNIKETSSADELTKYKNLLDNGAITQEEFNEKKKQLLDL